MSAEALLIDFEMNVEHEMVITRAPSIGRSELEEVEVYMLQGKQRLPRLLRMEWTDLDGTITFRYPLAGRRMLAHRLRTQPIAMRDFYTLVLAIVEALDDCKDYMLRPEGFLLDEQAIFIGESLEDVYLCYVPISQSRESKASEALLALAVQWIGSVSYPDGEGMKRVFQHLRGDLISWRVLRHMLIELIGESWSEEKSLPLESSLLSARTHNSSVHQPSYTPAPDQVLEAAVDLPRVFPYRQPEPDKLPHAIHEARLEMEPDDLPAPKLMQPESGDDEVNDERRSRMRWLFGTGFVISAALIWRYVYLPSGTSRSLLLAAGLTLVAAAALLLLWKKRYGAEDSEPEEQNWSLAAEAHAGVSAPALSAAERSMERAEEFKSQPAGAWKINRSDERAGVQSVNQRNESVQLHPPHVTGNEATVWLGGESKEDKDAAVKRWLQRESDGESRIVEVGGCFMIGRALEGVDFTDPAPGISRTHLEIQADHDQWTAKDVGSRNGSTLNGETMIPYKVYVLNNGDVLQLAGEKGPKYVLKAG